MDNNELDRILKEKLKGKLQMPIKMQENLKKEIEQKIQQEKTTTKKVKKYNKLKPFVSLVAVLILIFTANLLIYNNQNNNPEITKTVVAIKNIEPTKISNGILANDSEFIIYTDGQKATKEDVQRSIYIEPALEYKIEKINDEQYKLKFEQNIPDNTILKLEYIKNKITEDSWAYQTSNRLTITNTYPANGEINISKNTSIEIKFSYASVENLQENITITPEIKGNWEHLGNIWRLIPTEELIENQQYTIKINKGISAQQEILENDYIFSFTVNTELEMPKYTHNTISADEINTYKNDELVKIYFTTNYNTSNKLIEKLEISKFNTVDDFIEYLETKNYSNSQKVGEYDFIIKQNYIQLNKTLTEGYYVASIQTKEGKEFFNCPIQINNLAGYAISTERDVIFWVAEGNNLAENINVEYLGKEQKTNKDGIAEFKEIANGSKTEKFAKIGNTENKLVVGIYNYDLQNYPSGYIYTDRPLYKNTDTIHIWAFVPKELFYDDVEDEFYIQLGEEEKQKVNVDEEGNINYKIELNNHVDCENTYISLYYKETEIASRQVTIENYELQNYIYEVIKDKNYAISGSEYKFKVQVKHITGLNVPNKTVAIEYDNNIYRKTTNEEGIAEFSIQITQNPNNSTEPYYQTISIKNGDLEEYNTSLEELEIYIIDKNTYTKIEKTELNKYQITLYKIATDRNVDVDYDLKEIYDGFYNTEVEINLKETVLQKFITGYKYNPYTKEDEEEYSYQEIEENIKNISKTATQDGKVEIDTTKLNMKKDTEQNKYGYELEIKYKDGNGKEVVEIIYVYDEYQTEGIGVQYENYESEDMLYDTNPNINTYSYYTYRYILKRDKEKFSIGETVNLTLAESTQNGIQEIQNQGKILRIVLKENITQTDIIEDNNFNYTFKESDFPGCKITSAYLYNGKFYRMPIYYFDFNEEDRKIDIEITADKKEYKPGEEVTLEIKTTNQGKPIKSTVNISVVNKAVFELEEDLTNITEQIYKNKDYPIYTYSTYRDYLNLLSEIGGGGDKEIRGDFGDTACFETISTNSKGEAKISFKLPDNVTTYIVTAQSANKDLYIGVNKTEIVSKLDFFIQYSEPRNVKTSDDLVLNATSIAEQKYDVQYEFTIKELNKTINVTGSTNEIVTANFGKIPYGTYTAIIKGKHENQEDAIQYQFNIIESSQEVKAKETMDINNQNTIKPSKNPIVLEIYNKDMKQNLEYINFIEETYTQRLDTQIAYNEIQNIKNQYYNTQNSENYINLYDYEGQRFFKNLKNGEEDIVLTALISKYSKEYYNSLKSFKGYNTIEKIEKDDNIFEIYLLASANNEPVLTDLLYLKQEQNIDNYNKLLVTLSLEFLGDYQNAKELYNTIQLTEAEIDQYKSLIAIIETYINKTNAIEKINELIKNTPEDEYLRFAILAYFTNNSNEIEKQDTVKIISNNLNETVTINGMQVKTLTINDTQLNEIKFETNSSNLVVSYYYQTLLDNIENENIVKDIDIKLNENIKKGDTVTLTVNFNKQYEGEVKIALPNSLRLAPKEYDYKKYYLINNQIDYITFYKSKDTNQMTIPLIVTLDGNYKFENIVCINDGIYHISNSLEFNVK